MKKFVYAIYPFLLACYPVLALRNQNIVYVDLATAIRTLLIATLLTALLWLLFDLILFRDRAKSGIAAGLALVLLFSYGHLHIQSARIFGDPIRHSYLLLLLAIFFLGIVFLATRSPSAVEISRNFLSVAAVALVAMSLGQALYYEYGTYRIAREISAREDPPGTPGAPSQHPDIYLIVLDGHTRSDVLRKNFDYDNSAFLNELEDLGFFVAECSRSNYASTNLSLSSLFNMDYIPASSSDGAKLPPFKDTAVRKNLASMGYTFITFENRASGHFDLQEDIRLSHNQLLLGELNLLGGLNEFEKVMLKTSIAKFFLDTRLIPGFDEDGLARLENYEHYQQTLFILSKLEEVPALKSPKFVFVHLMVPHDPYIFTSDGEFKAEEDRPETGYPENVEFINRRILAAIQEILAGSKHPPIILLMGDHGPPTGRNATREDRMAILNAYYVGEAAKADLYDSITPVNSFRVVFNTYFGASYPYFPDVSHFAYRLKQLDEAPLVENECAPR